MNFLEAIHQGDLTAVRQQLAERPALLNQADAQGNTPLHYAVAQHDLALIEFLIHQGAEVTTQNQQGETAGEWYEEVINSLFNLEQLIGSKELRLVIENNNVEFVTDHLKKGASHSLRHSRGSTLLHLAVELQKPAIVKVILEGITQKDIHRLLTLKDSRGRTALDLAQQFSQYSTPVAKQVHSILQEKQRATLPEDNASISQPLLTAWPLLIDNNFKNKINELSNRLKNLITADDFEQLNPLRVVICQLAYITCRQALPGLSSLERRSPLEETLLKNLFGQWSNNTRLEFHKKLQATVDYLANLIQQQQVNQVIHFSNEVSYIDGWYCFNEKKIYLNPMAEKNSLFSLVITLIHETTHRVAQSYDFATMDYFINSKGCIIDFNQACQLASTGESEKLTPERVKLFELRQRLQEDKPDWQQQLNHWMALNNADTQTLAILLLATLPEQYAKFNKKKQTLLIKSQFLSEEYLKKHPAPLPLHLKTPFPALTQLQQAMISDTSSEDGQPGPSRTEPTNSSLRRILNYFKPEEQKVASPCLPSRSNANWSTTTGTPSPPGLSDTEPTNPYKFITNLITPLGDDSD